MNDSSFCPAWTFEHFFESLASFNIAFFIWLRHYTKRSFLLFMTESIFSCYTDFSCHFRKTKLCMNVWTNGLARNGKTISNFSTRYLAFFRQKHRNGIPAAEISSLHPEFISAENPQRNAGLLNGRKTLKAAMSVMEMGRTCFYPVRRGLRQQKQLIHNTVCFIIKGTSYFSCIWYALHIREARVSMRKRFTWVLRSIYPLLR